MSIIHFSSVFKALDRFVAQHNGTTNRLSDRLRQPVISTAREIIRIYGAFLLKESRKASFNTSNIPSLETNSVQLAKIAHVSPRTIRRHVKRLLEAQILTEKVYIGRKANYELRFNPNILLISGVKAVKNSQKSNKNQKIKKTDTQFFKNTIRTSCPQSNSSNNSYTNNIIIAVDNKMNVNRSLPSRVTKVEVITGNELSGYAEKEGGKKINEPLAQDTPGARNFKYSNEAEKEAAIPEMQTQAKDIDSRLEASGMPFLTSYVDSLWELAKKKLYNNVCLTEHVEKRAKELLYLWYQPVKKERLDKVHKVYVKRIELVQKYLAKNPEHRFVQLPHSYFDPTNKHGFAGTKAWYKDYIRSKQKTRLKLITHAQIRRFQHNEQKETSIQKPRIPLFKDCAKRIQQLRSPELLAQFYKAILNENNKNTFIPL